MFHEKNVLDGNWPLLFPRGDFFAGLDSVWTLISTIITDIPSLCHPEVRYFVERGNQSVRDPSVIR